MAPTDHHIFLTALGYQGGPTLWEFAPDGTLLSATRALGLPRGSELTGLVVGNNGHLYVRVSQNTSSTTVSWKVIEMDRAGTTIFSSFSPSPIEYAAVGGYDPASGNLFLIANTTGIETTPAGVPVSSLHISPTFDIAYNPLTQSIFGAYNTTYGFFLAEYTKDPLGTWGTSRFYDLSPTGLTRTFSLDVDPSTGLFYIQDMEQIVSFSLDQLPPHPGPLPPDPPNPVAVPDTASSLALLAIGLSGLVVLEARRTKRVLC